jgi:hypothetical protein
MSTPFRREIIRLRNAIYPIGSRHPEKPFFNRRVPASGIFHYFFKSTVVRKGNIPIWYMTPWKMTPGLEVKLQKMGCVYDDYVWQDKYNDSWKNTLIKDAIDSLPPEVMEMRQRRIDRANDMVFKHTTIPESMWNHQGNPFDVKHMYLTPLISKLAIERNINRDMFYKHE